MKISCRPSVSSRLTSVLILGIFLVGQKTESYQFSINKAGDGGWTLFGPSHNAHREWEDLTEEIQPLHSLHLGVLRAIYQKNYEQHELVFS